MLLSHPVLAMLSSVIYALLWVHCAAAQSVFYRAQVTRDESGDELRLYQSVKASVCNSINAYPHFMGEGCKCRQPNHTFTMFPEPSCTVGVEDSTFNFDRSSLAPEKVTVVEIIRVSSYNVTLKFPGTCIVGCRQLYLVYQNGTKLSAAHCSGIRSLQVNTYFGWELSHDRNQFYLSTNANEEVYLEVRNSITDHEIDFLNAQLVRLSFNCDGIPYGSLIFKLANSKNVSKEPCVPDPCPASDYCSTSDNTYYCTASATSVISSSSDSASSAVPSPTASPRHGHTISKLDIGLIAGGAVALAIIIIAIVICILWCNRNRLCNRNCHRDYMDIAGQ